MNEFVMERLFGLLERIAVALETQNSLIRENEELGQKALETQRAMVTAQRDANMAIEELRDARRSNQSGNASTAFKVS